MSIPLSLLTFQGNRSVAASIDDEDRLAADLSTLGRHPNGEVAADLAARIMSRAGSARLRNAAALLLSDLNARNKTPDIIDLLRRPGIGRSAGTPLFALDELGGRLPLDVAATLIAEGSFETRAETLTFMEEGRIDRVDETSTTKARSLLTSIAAGDDAEAAEAASLALDYLADARPNP